MSRTAAVPSGKAAVLRCPIVGAEKDKRFVLQTQLLYGIYDFPDPFVHDLYHFFICPGDFISFGLLAIFATRQALGRIVPTLVRRVRRLMR